MVQKNFHRDLGTKWVDEQFSLKKNVRRGQPRLHFFALEPQFSYHNQIICTIIFCQKMLHARTIVNYIEMQTNL